MPSACERLGVEEIGSAQGLEALRPEWEGLWRADPAATPFGSPGWLIPWWKQIGRGELMTLAVREQGRLVALAPLYIYEQPGTGMRSVFPLGIGTSDYLDALALPQRRERAMEAVWGHLHEQRGRWDECEFPQLRPGALLLEGGLPEGWVEEGGACEPCPMLELADPLPQSLAQNLRYYRRKAQKMGEVRLEECAQAFDDLVRLHTARWSAREKPGVLCDVAVRRWHEEAIAALAGTGLVRVYRLWIGQRVAAALYGLVDRPGIPGRRFYYYLSGFEPELEKVSPGTLVIAAAMEEARREGCAVFDFLRGREPYKYLWGARDLPAYRRRLRVKQALSKQTREAVCERS